MSVITSTVVVKYVKDARDQYYSSNIQSNGEKKNNWSLQDATSLLDEFFQVHRYLSGVLSFDELSCLVSSYLKCFKHLPRGGRTQKNYQKDLRILLIIWLRNFSNQDEETPVTGTTMSILYYIQENVHNLKYSKFVNIGKLHSLIRKLKKNK